MAEVTKEKNNIHQNHRSRVKQKFLNHGLDSFAEHEILELLLFYAIPQADTNPVAHALLNKFKSIKNVFDASYENLLSVQGMGSHSALLIKLIPQIMQVYNIDKSKTIKKLDNQLVAKEYVCHLFEGISREEFYIICLNEKNDIISTKKESTGDFAKVEVQIRTVTDYVFKNNCARVIIAHNHPAGKSIPSDDDIVMTHKLCSSCMLNDIDLIDHVIYSPEGCYSFAEEGTMRNIKKDIMDMLKYSSQSLPYKKFSASIDEYVIIKEKDAYNKK